MKVLSEVPVECAPTPFASTGIRLQKKIALQNMPLFRDGGVEVQDEGSQLLAQIVGAKRGEMVVDFCAGAGGKTLALAVPCAIPGVFTLSTCLTSGWRR